MRPQHRPHPLPTWLAVLGVLLVAGNLRAAITSVGPLLPVLQASLELASFEASLLISLPLLAFALISPVAPRLALRLGIEASMALSLLVLAAGLLLRSTPPVALLWLGTALIGVSIAVLNVVLPALVKRDFPSRIGQVTGAYSAVQSALAALAAGTAVPVAELSSLGWRLPLGMWAGFALLAAAVVTMLMRRPGRHRSDAAATVRAPSAPQRSPWSSLLAWQVTAFMGLQSLVFYVVITWLPSIEVAAGTSAEAAGVHQMLLNGLAILGSLVASSVISRLRDQRLLGMGIPLLMLASTLGTLLAPDAGALWACMFGFSFGSSIVLALSLFGLRTAHHVDAGALSGMAQGVGYTLAAAGPIVAGLLRDATGSWTPTLVTLLAAELVLVGFGYLAGRNRTMR